MMARVSLLRRKRNYQDTHIRVQGWGWCRLATGRTLLLHRRRLHFVTLALRVFKQQHIASPKVAPSCLQPIIAAAPTYRHLERLQRHHYLRHIDGQPPKRFGTRWQVPERAIPHTHGIREGTDGATIEERDC